MDKNKDILYSLNVASKLTEDANEQSPQPQSVTTPTTGADQNNPQVNEEMLEKAFEAALDNVKNEILKSFQTTLEKFGEQLISNMEKAFKPQGNMNVSTNELNKASGNSGDQPMSQQQNNGGENNGN